MRDLVRVRPVRADGPDVYRLIRLGLAEIAEDEPCAVGRPIRLDTDEPVLGRDLDPSAPVEVAGALTAKSASSRFVVLLC